MKLTYLKHMRDHAVEALSFSRGRTRDDLDRDRMYLLATCRLLEMMGESANQLPVGFRDSTPGIPWKQLIGLRHRLVHAYDEINFDILWNIVTTSLPPIVVALDALIGPSTPDIVPP